MVPVGHSLSVSSGTEVLRHVLPKRPGSNVLLALGLAPLRASADLGLLGFSPR